MGAAGGVATLDVNGKLTIGQLPAVAITNTYVVASEQAQLALSCQLGDMVIRTDQTKSYINNGGTTGTMADWVWIEAPDPVQSINGQTGNVIWPLPCIVVTGDPGAYSAPLSDDNDSPAACANTYGVNLYVKWVACMADQGTPTVDVRLTGGASVISAPIPCGSTATAGTISGTPMIHPVGADGATCATAPCSLDVDIVAAGGLAKYLVVRVGLATQ
jgi:hypothetical protein